MLHGVKTTCAIVKVGEAPFADSERPVHLQRHTNFGSGYFYHVTSSSWHLSWYPAGSGIQLELVVAHLQGMETSGQGSIIRVGTELYYGPGPKLSQNFRIKLLALCLDASLSKSKL